MERALTLLSRHTQLLLHHIDSRVVRQLQVINARHDAREVVVRRVRRLARLAYDREHWCESIET
jgi:hypothetical protein